MERLLKVLASSNSSLLHVDSYSKHLGISVNSIKKYLDILEGSYIIKRLQPLYLNITKRLIRSPKIYIRDSGLLHRLIGLQDLDQLLGSPWSGHSWEAYVIEEIYKAGGKLFEYFFYRTQAGAEVDLVLKGGKMNSTVNIELKYSSNSNPAKGFYSEAIDIQPTHQYIIIPEGECWSRNENIKVCGLHWFLNDEIHTF